MLIVSQVIEMNHTSTIRLPGVSVWSECLTASRERHCGLLISDSPFRKYILTILHRFNCVAANVTSDISLSPVRGPSKTWDFNYCL